MAKTLRSDAHGVLVTLLKQAREAAGLTQAMVADRLGKLRWLRKSEQVG